jgi:hypothetical protein
VFIDIVGYIGDNPAVTHALDVLGHNSRPPCHLCGFLKQDRSGTEGLHYYGYSTSVHSRASSFCRDCKRIKSVRSGLVSSSLLQTLGLKSTVELDIIVDSWHRSDAYTAVGMEPSITLLCERINIVAISPCTYAITNKFTNMHGNGSPREVAN